MSLQVRLKATMPCVGRNSEIDNRSSVGSSCIGVRLAIDCVDISEKGGFRREIQVFLREDMLRSSKLNTKIKGRQIR